MERRSKDPRAGAVLRHALTEFMRHRNLTPNRWSKLAKEPESSLRNFLAGRSQTLTHRTLDALAQAAEVPVSTLMKGATLWKGTETVEIDTPINANPRTAADLRTFDKQKFIVTIRKNIKYANITKFGAYVEDESADILFPPCSTLICVDFPWTLHEEENIAAPRSGDILIVQEKLKNSQTQSDIRFLARKLVVEGKDNYLISCSSRARFIEKLRLPVQVAGKVITQPILTNSGIELTILGKVLTSICDMQL